MKRKQQGAPSSNPSRKIRAIGATRLTAVRGGDDLGITVDPGTVSANYMSLQHNEALIRF